MSNSEHDEKKLVKELLESAKSQEDKILAARIVAQKDDQKVTNAIRTLMAGK